MADVEALVDLLERWRAAGPVERVRVALDARRHIGALSPGQKRALAVEVASRVAPQLVPQIEDEDGDLSPEQVQALVDLLRRADDEDLGDLVGALRRGEVSPALALVDDALDVVAPPPLPDEPVVERVEELAEEPAEGLVDGPVEEQAEAGDEPEAGDGLEAADEALDAAEHRAEALQDALADEASLREQVEAAARSSDRWRESSPAPTGPAYELPDTFFDLDADELPDTSVEVVATVLERAESDARASAALRAGARPGPAATAPALVRDVPDGYRRRRVALRALRDGRLADVEEVLAVVRALGRETDRAWVAGAALDAGVLDVDDLAQVRVTDAARARLARRAA